MKKWLVAVVVVAFAAGLVLGRVGNAQQPARGMQPLTAATYAEAKEKKDCEALPPLIKRYLDSAHGSADKRPLITGRVDDRALSMTLRVRREG